MAKIYVTKWALTSGIQVVNAPQNIYYRREDWHTTWVDAVARAELMRGIRIASLEKSLGRVRALTFPLTPAES